MADLKIERTRTKVRSGKPGNATRDRNLIPGPFADGFDKNEFNKSVEDAQEFFGYSRETCEERIRSGSKIFKQAQDAFGLDYAYDVSEGAIWDLLAVRATVSSGLPEILRSTIVGELLEKYLPNPDEHFIADWGCGIGREALEAVNKGYAVIGVDRGETLRFANFFVHKYFKKSDRDIDELWFPYDPLNFGDKGGGEVDAFICLEYLEHDPDPEGRIDFFWDDLKMGGYLICNARSFNAHDTGHLPENFHYQFEFEQIIADHGFKCLYFPWNPPNIYNIAVFQKVPKGEGEYNGATTEAGEW